ncbi:unnamed protein product, partial [Adineta steineri]
PPQKIFHPSDETQITASPPKGIFHSSDETQTTASRSQEIFHPSDETQITASPPQGTSHPTDETRTTASPPQESFYASNETQTTVSPPQEIFYPSDERQTTPSPLQRISHPSDETPAISQPSNEQGVYRLHIASQPGAVIHTDPDFKMHAAIHSELMSLAEFILNELGVAYRPPRNELFSISAWGMEPYTGVILHCSETKARGVAAIFGLALRQEAI